MAGELAVRIKRQPHEPPFVLRIGDEDVPARIAKLNDHGVAASIKGLGIYRIDTSNVGFWFVDREAKPWEPGRSLPEIHGGILERSSRAVARSLGHHCGSVISEFGEVLDALLGNGRSP